jgi:glycosyltransferase involved in cell wall biosynthesis
MRRIRVLFLAPVAYFKGGAERSLFDLMSNRSIDPVLVTPGPGSLAAAAEERSIPVKRLDFVDVLSIHRPFNFLDGFRQAKSVIKATWGLRNLCMIEKVDILHSNGLKAHSLAVLCKLLGGPPVVAHIRDAPYTRGERIFWRLLAAFASQTIVISTACWPGKILPKYVSLVPNGFTLPEVPFRSRHIIEPITIGYVGRIHPNKGLHLLLKWMSAARSAGLDLRLRVRGLFAPEVPSYENEILAAVRDLDLTHCVSFDGFISESSELYAGLDIVCVPSVDAEPFGRSVMEAMSLGLVVLATASGGIKDLISDENNGFFVNSAGEFTKIVRSLSKDAALVDRIRNNARRTCAENYSMERLYLNIHGVYEKLVAPARNPTTSAKSTLNSA